MFVILYKHRHPTKGLQTRAYQETFTEQDDAETAVMFVGAQYKAPAWIIECEEPRIVPQLKVVEKPIEGVIEGDTLIIDKR